MLNSAGELYLGSTRISSLLFDIIAASDDFALFTAIGHEGTRFFCAREAELGDLTECDLDGFGGSGSAISDKSSEILTALTAGPGGLVVLSTEAIYWVRGLGRSA